MARKMLFVKRFFRVDHLTGGKRTSFPLVKGSGRNANDLERGILGKGQLLGSHRESHLTGIGKTGGGGQTPRY